METTQILESTQAFFSPWSEKFAQPEEGRLDVYLPADKIVEVVQAVVNTGLWRLSAITGMDLPQTQQADGQIELLYHFCQKAVVLTLRIQVSYGEPTVESICGVIPAAVLYEREAMEMLGVIFDGIPMRDRLLLSDDWPDWVYPLRKSFQGLES